MDTYEETLVNKFNVDMKEIKENKKLIFDEPIKINVKYIVKIIASFFYEFIIRLLFIKKKQFNTKRYHISICACFKNEGAYLKEWIEYHKMIGVDHFYLYNNNSTDNYRQVLEGYENSGIVTLIDYPDVPCQPGVYQHWCDNFIGESDWVTFIDVDEFYCPLKHNNLKEWLDEHNKYPLLVVYWKMFGTSAQLTHSKNKLVIEQYTVSWPKLDSIGKQFYNTNYKLAKLNKGSHHATYIIYRGLKIPALNVFGHFETFGLHQSSNKEPDIQLNHYWSKAYDVFEKKHERGSSAFGASWRTFDKFLWHEYHNTACDYSIYRYITQLKLQTKDSIIKS